MALIHAYQRRGLTEDIQVLDVDGAVITPGENDKVRAIIGRVGQLGSDLSGAKLVLTSGEAPTAAGSSFTKNSPSDGYHRLRLDATDLAAIAPGVWTLFIDYFDNADAQEWKNVSRQVFVLEGT